MRPFEGKQPTPLGALALRRLTLIYCCCLIVAVASTASSAHHYSRLDQETQSTTPAQPKPSPAPARWRGLIGEYGPDDNILMILETDGRLVALFNRKEIQPLTELTKDLFRFPELGPRSAQTVIFTRDAHGRATHVTLLKGDAAGSHPVLKRRQIEPESGNQLHVKPLRPVVELMKEARVAQPPQEKGEFRESDLVDVAKMNRTIRLEIRYATTNNFLSTVFYSEARAFLQEPAAKAVVRASLKLKALGYGLLIHDAYRPWYVTKVFWDATPDDKRVFVADPSKGSRHNRGCAVDLTLYDLKTKKPVEMVSTYDETTARAYPDYPGGTSLQRWHRKLLRDTMESEGFTVYEAEWWHFDYKDWQKYRIGNVKFEQIGRKTVTTISP